MPQCENCTKFWKFVTPQLMVFLNLWFFAGIRWGGSNRESWRTSRGEHADERIRKSHLQVLRSFGIKWDFKWGHQHHQNFKKILISVFWILIIHLLMLPPGGIIWFPSPIKIVSFVTLFLHQSACHSSTLKNSLFLSFKTRI